MHFFFQEEHNKGDEMTEPYNFTEEHSTISGLCFFEVVSKCLMELKDSRQFSVQKLKDDCLKYLNDNEWVRMIVLGRAKTYYGNDTSIGDKQMWDAYKLALKYDAKQMTKMAISDLAVDKIVYNTFIKDGFRNVCLDAICGRLEVEGRILTEMYGIKINLVNDDEKLSTVDSNTIYLVKRGLNHYDKFVEKNVPNKKLPEEDCPSTSAAANPSNTLDSYKNLKETNKQDETSNNLLNDFTSKYTAKNDKTKIDNTSCNIPGNFIVNVLDSDTASAIDNDTDNMSGLDQNQTKQSNKKRGEKRRNNNKTGENRKNKKNDLNKLANDLNNCNITTNEMPDNSGNKQGRRDRQRNKNQHGKCIIALNEIRIEIFCE